MTQTARTTPPPGIGVRIAAIAVITLVVGWTFLPAVDFPFLNWDDLAVIVRNDALDGSDIIRWAFTTTYMEHYQPISWLVWAGIKRFAGAGPAGFHAVSIVAHVVCAWLVFAVLFDVLRRAAPAVSPGRGGAIACAAALLYAVHPLRVEVVAWISALPYALALALSLLAVLAWLRTTASRTAAWWTAAFALYAASLAARPVALGLPIVLVAIDVMVLSRRPRASVARVWPFALLAGIAAMVEGLARTTGMNDAPWLYRLQSSALAPLVYVAHTIWPVQLTPLDVLPANPVAHPATILIAALTLIALLAASVLWRHRWPWISALVAMYLALLAPAAGLVSSGLQATADRYTYLPGVVLSIGAVLAVAYWARRSARRRFVAGGAAVVLIAVSALTTRETLKPWADSITLWSRVIALDPANDVGLYNLAEALASAGRADEAVARYRELLAMVPAHTAARANLGRLDAARFERDGSASAARGDMAAAVESYQRALALDDRRTAAHAGLGMALASLGRTAEAIPSLRAAVSQGVADPMVPNALAGLLMESGRTDDARTILEDALSAHAGDIDLTHNLARLLASAPRFASADASRALRLAGTIVEATRGQDARALDTLAVALAANGRMREAAETSNRAARLAASQGDRELAVQITARGRGYRNPGQ